MWCASTRAGGSPCRWSAATGGGANELARAVGEVLGAEPVVTTATDAVGLAGLDTLGLPVEGDVAGVSRALLDGEPVALRSEVRWPLPPPARRRGGVRTRSG